MNIATIQKRKFLNNIYKLLYSSGTQPSEEKVRQLFDRYFSVNKLGSPVLVDFNKIDFSEVVDSDLLNELMINSIFNMEILYDCINENNYEMMSTITSLNKKLSNLKLKRKELEDKVNQLIFSNSNSDGFYYSFFETFSSTKNVDMFLTSSYIDTEIGNVTIPKITSTVSSSLTSSLINPSSVRYSLSQDGSYIFTNKSVENFDNVFDGLTDTYWNYTHYSSRPSVVLLEIDIPIPTNLTISKIEGFLLSPSAIGTIISATPTDANAPVENKFKSPKEDYDKFSFVLNPVSYNSIKITLYKTSADEVSNNSDKPYIYNFGIRDLFIGAKYYDKRSTIVSTPISVPNPDNKLLAIESVSIEVDQQIGSGYSVNYFVAPDVDTPSGIDSFDWVPIDPTNVSSSVNPTIVNLQTTNKVSKLIYTGASVNNGYDLTPLNSTSSNINELNPNANIYSGKSVYRIATLSQEVINQPVILNGINSIRNYAVIKSSTVNQNDLYKSLNIWAQTISEKSSDLLESPSLVNQLQTISPGFNSICSGLMEFKVNSDKELSAIHSVTKSRSDFNLAIYLNDILIGDIPSGTSSRDIQWDFKKGINYVKITYDKNFEGLINFSIMSGKNISDYGTVFLDYYSYLDPYEFRQRVSDNSYVFTIDNVFGARSIISSKYLYGTSEIKFYGEMANAVSAVRYRADLFRGNNPLVSPAIDSIRVKFKHNEEV